MSPDTLDRPAYIIIEGAIGVGKTTLARMLSQHLGTGLLLEVFEENPFLAKFYESRARYAFQTQMFFLLSRYRQQQQLVPQIQSQGALISDYMFAKDRLFAQLNLAGDEWEVYQQIHNALAEQIPAPDLIVYLQADTDVLMGRIAQRDRPYERAMDRDYIEALRQAYERYFLQRSCASTPQECASALKGWTGAQQKDIPVLFLDTNQLNYITNPDDLRSVAERIRAPLREGTFQQTPPEFATGAFATWQQAEGLLSRGRPLADYQRFHVELDEAKGFSTDMYFNHLRLSEEVGELSRELARLWVAENALVAQGLSQTKAHEQALSNHHTDLESELADCMAYLLKLANYAGIDLEQAYLQKMKINQDRTWHLP